MNFYFYGKNQIHIINHATNLFIYFYHNYPATLENMLENKKREGGFDWKTPLHTSFKKKVT